MAAPAAITLDNLIERTGREKGPDICLKVDTDVKALINTNPVITAQSNITEVLNVIAYFCNANANRTDANGINTDDSIKLDESGLHTDNTGRYSTANTGNGAHNGSLWNDDNGTVTTQMIDINNLTALAGVVANHIPVGILMRNGNGAAGELKNTNIATDVQRAIAAVAAAGPIPDGSVLKIVFINCIKQMINIMEQTRTIFGPKGWANLYRKMNGGGNGANKNHIKRTHRQHRRRYSSKQY